MADAVGVNVISGEPTVAGVDDVVTSASTDDVILQINPANVTTFTILKALLIPILKKFEGQLLP